MAPPSQNPRQTQELDQVFKGITEYAQTQLSEIEKQIQPDYMATLKNIRYNIAKAYGEYGTAGTLNYQEMQRYGRLQKSLKEIDKGIQSNMKGVGPKVQRILSETASVSYARAAATAPIPIRQLTANEITGILNRGVSASSVAERAALRQQDLSIRVSRAIKSKLLQNAPMEDTWDSVGNVVKQAFIRDVTSLSDEAHAVGQNSIIEALKEGSKDSGLFPTKIWVTAGDDKVRDAHWALDGQEVDANEPFTIGKDSPFAGGSGTGISKGATEWDGYQADGPMQFGEPALDYNCRCGIVGSWRQIEEVETLGNEIELTPEMRSEAQDIREGALKRAPAIRDELGEIVTNLGGNINGDQPNGETFNYLKGMVKSEGSIGEQIAIEKSKEYKRTGKELSTEDAANKVKDITRFTATYDSGDFLNNYYDTSDALENQGWGLVDVSNKFTDARDYNGINTYWVRDGYLVEVQFHTPETVYVKETYSHPLYEQARVILDQDPQSMYKRYNLYLQSADTWEQVNRPYGVDEIISWEAEDWKKYQEGGANYAP